MIENGVLRFRRSQKGLARTREFWQSESFRDRDRHIVEYYKSHSGGHIPCKNMWYIREMELDIDDHVSLKDLIKATEYVKNFFIIDCFQISIDRKNQQAHLLFDFFNKETLACVQIHSSNIALLQVFFIKHLGLSVKSKSIENIWSHFSIRCELMENPNVLEDLLMECKHIGLSRFYYQIIKDLVNLVEIRMSKSTEQLKKIK